jgi:U3 small nucleolar ribonucleoprotein protein LCP5
MVEGRVVLEKIKVLEGRMRYQIEKLVRVAEEVPSSNQNVIDGLCSSIYASSVIN